MIEANALAAMEQKVEKAVRQGAKLLCGGHRIGTKGYFFEPTVLDCATQEWISYGKRPSAYPAHCRIYGYR